MGEKKEDKEKQDFLKKVDEIHQNTSMKECPLCGNFVKVEKGVVCGCGKSTWTGEGWKAVKEKEEKEKKDDETTEEGNGILGWLKS